MCCFSDIVRGSSLDRPEGVHVKPDRDQSPCPFCGSSAILLIGGSLVYLHYRCGQCLELWTVTASPNRIGRHQTLRVQANQTIH
jgi:transposase-like protein